MPHPVWNLFTAITPSNDRFNLLIFARTCSKLYLYVNAVQLAAGGVESEELTMAISERSAARCDSKYDRSGATFVEAEACGRFVEEDMLRCGFLNGFERKDAFVVKVAISRLANHIRSLTVPPYLTPKTPYLPWTV